MSSKSVHWGLSIGEPSGVLVAQHFLAQGLLTIETHDLVCGTGLAPELRGESFLQLEKIAVSGFLPVLWALPTLLKLRFKWLKWLNTPGLKKLILVDYPGFNLWLLKEAQRRKIPVYYVAPPQVWLWKPHRVKHLQNIPCFTLFQHEHEFLLHQGVSSTWIGHPFLTHVPVEQSCLNPTGILALYPGSRLSRFKTQLPYFLAAAKFLQNQDSGIQQIYVVLAPFVDHRPYIHICQKQGVNWISENEIAHLKIRGALAFPGTVTLKLWTDNIPHIVCGFASPWSTWIVRRILQKHRFLSLASQIAKTQVVDEIFLPNHGILQRAWQNLFTGTWNWLDRRKS